MLADHSRAQLLVIDVQSRLAPHVAGAESVVDGCCKLVRYARALDVPMTLTEHYPKGLGATVPAVLDAIGGNAEAHEKIAFSCWRDDTIRTRLAGLRAEGRDQIVVAGMEAHVCVGQTVLDLIAEGFIVFLVGDSVGSRSPEVRDIAVRRMAAAGADIVAHEMVAFEWLRRGDAPGFKAVIEILK